MRETVSWVIKRITNIFQVKGKEVVVDLNCADPTWVCEADGYDPAYLDIPVPVLESESSVSAVMM